MASTDARTVRLAKRAAVLQNLFEIDEIEPLGIYPKDSDLERIEYVLHELAHGLTMGFERFPAVLPAAVELTLGRFSAVTNDHLEIDTAFVTHGTMVELKLVKREDQHKFAAKCAAAMTTNRYTERMYLVLDEMEERALDCELNKHVQTLACMFRAPMPLVRATYLLHVDE